jgi:ubiquinone/menaquinone biosynthesis C-methylase UbiE
LILPAAEALEALDIGCRTGFLSLELAFRGHRVTGIDFAPAMQLPFSAASFDIAISRHLLWTLPHPEQAIDEWIRVLRPGGRLIVVDSKADVSSSPGRFECNSGKRGLRRGS